MELIKRVTPAGNSSKVLLPRNWMGGVARVELIEKPANITEDTLKIISPYLKDTKGVYLCGSYARGDETKNSDIDILVITNKTNKKVKGGRYEITLISEANLKKLMNKNALPILPMIKESRTILNEKLIGQYKKMRLNETNLKPIKEITKSSREICKERIKISRERNEENIADEVIYSLILGLRTVYTINSIKSGKIPSTKGLIDLIVSITASKEPYSSYLRAKSGKRPMKTISVDNAEKLNNHIIKSL